MSLKSVRAFFAQLELDLPILETEALTPTVELAALAHGVAPGRIAKTLAFRLIDGRVVLLVANGHACIDNAKFKTAFGKGKPGLQGGGIVVQLSGDPARLVFRLYYFAFAQSSAHRISGQAGLPAYFFD